jgi:hypothetical protein
MCVIIQVNHDCDSDPSSPVKLMQGDLAVIPLLRPPIIAKERGLFNPAAALLARALAESPGLLSGEAALETVTALQSQCG